MYAHPCSHAWTAAETVSHFKGDIRRGLTSAEAHFRLTHYGHNALQRGAGPPLWLRFLRQFRNVQVYLLLAAIVVSLLAWVMEYAEGLPYEALTIAAILLLNALFGFLQEERADRALVALRRMTPTEASVIRDAQLQRIDARLLVPGDLLVLREGDRIGADARLLDVTAFHTQESALTGESFSVSKITESVPEDTAPADRRNTVYSGTIAVSGHARAIVTATGTHTEFGRIASLLQETEERETPLTKELDSLGQKLGLAVVIIAGVVISTLLLLHGARNGEMGMRILLFGVALAVAATPEGLAAVTTVVLALGVQRMARRGAIIRHLAAVETLGEATVIASDKTGTLTMNEMTVRLVVTASGRAVSSATGYRPEGVWKTTSGDDLDQHLRHEITETLLAAALVNNATLQHQDGTWKIQGDPTEGALLAAAATMEINLADLVQQCPRIGEIPFSSERKRMSTIHHCTDSRLTAITGSSIMMTKGAADLILERCTQELFQGGTRPLTQERREQLISAHDGMATQSLRALGIAARSLPGGVTLDNGMETFERDLTFLGLVGMIDPPRPEARAAVAKAKAAGIRPILITGDHAATARAIARDLGIGVNTDVITGRDLEAMSDDELAKALRLVSIFARVDPGHKLRIVRALQHNGEIVAMTGDGVNDAPALKAADIGVAMGITGTDVAKEAADLVLTDDNFATIVAAVEEGRAIFDNIRKFLRYLLATNFGEILTLFFGVVLATILQKQLGQELLLPLLAVQVLWINLVTDGAPALALGLDPPAQDIMRRVPLPAGARVVDAPMVIDIAIVGVVMTTGTLSMFLGRGRETSIQLVQTLAFTTLIFFQLINTLNARSHRQSAFRGLFRNCWLWSALLGTFALQVLVLNLPLMEHALSVVPLTLGQWAGSIIVASSVLWTMEAVKWFRRLRALTEPAPVSKQAAREGA
jgi:P-type Ca2+ transporter type 2C